MRLIDADEVIKRIEENIKAYYEESSGGYYLAEDVIDEINSMPTAHSVTITCRKFCSNYKKCSSEGIEIHGDIIKRKEK